ncbi:hypothetical protein CLCAR_3897 [Clostridium carboxidivorans P7]|nr:hypothetical protein CLCAR_3897 [Clostridium carboxidivorans P7]
MVKLYSADGTAGEALWKSRSLPGYKQSTKYKLSTFYFEKI